MFFAKNRNLKKYVDGIYPITNACKNDKNINKVNGTIGSLYNEEKTIVAYKTVYQALRNLSNENIASYASGSFGNKDYNDAISNYVLEDRINNYRTIPTPGGTGAINMAINMCLEKGDSIILPEVAWGNYKNIALEYDLNVLTYDIYDLDSLLILLDKLDKIFIVINSPCQNPCGLSYTFEQWKRIVDYLNNCNKEAIILNDVAYMDYSYNQNYKDYFELFNHLNNNVLILIAYSCSKAFSFYGVRLGSLFVIHNDEVFLDDFINQCARRARATYSNVNNGAMKAIVELLNNHYEEYILEKNYYISLLKKRSNIFINECKDNGLDIYPYDEGFFVTLKFDDNNIRDEAFEKLFNEHLYFIKMNKGIRVGICAIPIKDIYGLAKRIKSIISG